MSKKTTDDQFGDDDNFEFDAGISNIEKFDEVPPLRLTSKTRLQMKINRLKVFGEWKWTNTKDDSCGICRARFEACCTDCKFPGDECPVVIGECRHPFHMHCIVKWTSAQSLQSRAACPLCRQEWKYTNN